MHFHIPKPLHGWRAFAGEVGIIVVGVLIALGAQQVVEGIRDRAEQSAFRETIDHEIGLNLFMYHVRSRQFDCDKEHADELVNWVARARAGERVPVLFPVPPLTITPYRSAWDNRDSRVFDELPAKQRQKYAEFYDELSNNWTEIAGESAQWRLLNPYKEIGPISQADRRALRPIISEIYAANGDLQANIPLSLKIADLLSVKEISPDNMPAEFMKRLGECRSVIASPSDTLLLNPEPARK